MTELPSFDEHDHDMANVAGQPPVLKNATEVYTYHCICTQLILATTTTPLQALTERAGDHSLILPLPPSPTESHYAALKGTALDSRPTAIRREDGFEKRYMHRCSRCDIVVGYQLDKSQWEESKGDSGRREDVIYLLRGGLMETAEMEKGKDMEREMGLVQAKG